MKQALLPTVTSLRSWRLGSLTATRKDVKECSLRMVTQTTRVSGARTALTGYNNIVERVLTHFRMVRISVRKKIMFTQFVSDGGSRRLLSLRPSILSPTREALSSCEGPATPGRNIPLQTPSEANTTRAEANLHLSRFNQSPSEGVILRCVIEGSNTAFQFQFASDPHSQVPLWIFKSQLLSPLLE
jgi:hypothetical protein